MKRPNTKKGFTLIELLLYVGAASTVLLVATLFMSTLLESRVKNQTVAEVEQQGVQVMQIITQTVRNAESITAPSAGGSAPSLTLNVFDAGNDPTIFTVASGTIRVTEGSDPSVALTNARVVASGFTLQNLSRTDTPGIIRISFTLTHVNSSGRNEFAFSKTFYGSASLRQP